MKKILQRIAFFSFLGCLTLIGIASYKGNSHLKCEQEWKHGLVKKTGSQETLVVTDAHDHSYELSWPVKAFEYVID